MSETYSYSPTLPRINRFPAGYHNAYSYLNSRMSNIPDITQRQNKSSSAINTSYRDAYRPWFKSSDSSTKGVNGTLCGIKRSNRGSSLSIVNVSCSLNLVYFLTPNNRACMLVSSHSHDSLINAPLTSPKYIGRGK